MVDVGKTKPDGFYEVTVSYVSPTTGCDVTEAVSGKSDNVAAWLRALADRIDPVEVARWPSSFSDLSPF